MKLKKGISIHNLLPAGYDAIAVNSGTVFHTEQPAPLVNFQGHHYRPQYEDKAYVAKRDWRRLDATETAHLRAGDNRNDYNTVYLGELPESLKDQFRQLNLADAANRQGVMQTLQQNEQATRQLNAGITAFLQPLSNKKPFQFHCLGINFPNIELVACNTTKLPPGYKPEDVRYMGMHNDGAVKMTIHTAHKFGNRISINLGKEARYFLFVNLSLVQALNMLKKKIDIQQHAITYRNLPTFFFKYFPDYPVLRVRQEPYQYYIAATDNCFHDGSTLGMTSLDICFVYFGAFSC